MVWLQKQPGHDHPDMSKPPYTKYGAIRPSYVDAYSKNAYAAGIYLLVIRVQNQVRSLKALRSLLLCQTLVEFALIFMEIFMIKPQNV